MNLSQPHIILVNINVTNNTINPLALPLKLAKHFLRIDHDDDNDLIVQLIKSAEEKIRAYTNNDHVNHDISHNDAANNDEVRDQDRDQKKVKSTETMIVDIMTMVIPI